MFEYDGQSWIETQKLTITNQPQFHQFGQSVVLREDQSLISAYGDDENGDNSGAVYVFDFDGSSWAESAKLSADDAEEGDLFGNWISSHENRLLIGAPGDDVIGQSSGSAYVFELQNGDWTQVTRLAPDVPIDRDGFGYRVSLSDTKALVSVYHDTHNGSGPGAAYLFDLIDGSWVETEKLVADDGASLDKFGWAVSQDGNLSVIGSQEDDDLGSESGSAYVFDVGFIFADDFE